MMTRARWLLIILLWIVAFSRKPQDHIQMRRTKSTVRRSYMVATSSSSSKDDMFLGTDQEEAHAPTRDTASSSTVSQRRGDVPSQQNQFTRTRHIGRITFQCSQTLRLLE